MNLLCPNCQKMLTVPEQYAGQLMKCPLCAGTFTVPTLPPIPSAPEPAPLSPPPPMVPPPASETYGVKKDPVVTPPPSYKPEPVSSPIPPGPSPPLSPSQPSTPLTPGGYTKTHTLGFSPKTLQWVAPVCVFLIFILQLFSWVGLYPGGVPVLTQGAWSSAFGVSSEEDDTSKITTVAGSNFLRLEASEKPGASFFMIFYVFLFLPTLILTIAVIVLPHINVKLPPPITKLLPYRWGVVAALNLLTFLFLALQMLFGFSVESTVAQRAEKFAKEKYPDDTQKDTTSKLAKQAYEGQLVSLVQRTFWLRLVVLLHLLAVISAALMYWIGQRGETRPLPKIELLY